jgi:hypothetical protein
MVSKILFIICLVSQTLLAQKINCSGKLLDKNSKAPIFGVGLTLENNVVCYSDEEGNFEFDIEKPKVNKIITFSHVSYVPARIVVSDFEKGAQTIALTESTTELEEVVVTPVKKIPQKNILKIAMKQFKTNSRAAPYWSEMNYKQSVLVDGVPKGYFECDGHIFMPGKNKSPWVYPMTIPNQIRRLNEDPRLMELNFYQNNGIPNDYVYVGSSFLSTLWFNYRLFEVVHPLSSEGRGAYDFKIIETSFQGDSDYYIIRFTQKEKIIIGGWNIRYMSGLLWIDKKDFNLKKVSPSFGYDKHCYNQYVINYNLIANKLYPVKIEVNNFDYRNASKQVSNLVKSGTFTFNKIDLIERKNYSRIYVSYLIYDLTEKYDKNYWKVHPLEDLKYKNHVMTILENSDWNTAFEKGAKEREYNENSNFSKRIKYFEKENLELEQIMKRDLNLK